MAEQANELFSHLDTHVRQVFRQFDPDPEDVVNGWICQAKELGYPSSSIASNMSTHRRVEDCGHLARKQSIRSLLSTVRERQLGNQRHPSLSANTEQHRGPPPRWSDVVVPAP